MFFFFFIDQSVETEAIGFNIGLLYLGNCMLDHVYVCVWFRR